MNGQAIIPNSGSTLPVAEAARRDTPAFVRAGDRLTSIGGRRVPAVFGQMWQNIDPSWAGMAPDRRGRLLNQVADVFREDAEELASIDSVNMGAPRSLADGVFHATGRQKRELTIRIEHSL